MTQKVLGAAAQVFVAVQHDRQAPGCTGQPCRELDQNALLQLTGDDIARQASEGAACRDEALDGLGAAQFELHAQ